MRENCRVKQQRFEVSLSAKQATCVVVGALVVLGGAFLAGMSAGRRAAVPAEAAAAAPGDALARLDQPLPAREEAPPVLQAHQALTDSRALDKTLPVKAEPTSPSGADENGSGQAVAPPPVASAPAVATPPAAAPAANAAAGRALPEPAPAEPSVAKRSERVTKPAPAKAIAGTRSKGAYTIQVAATPRRADAERLARRLAPRKSRIVAADVPGKGRWYRVQVGSYESRDAAKGQLAALSRSGIQGLVTAAR